MAIRIPVGNIELIEDTRYLKRVSFRKTSMKKLTKKWILKIGNLNSKIVLY